MRTFLTFTRRAKAVACVSTLLLGCTLVARAAADGDADLQFQLGTLLFEETRYQEALRAFDRAMQTDDRGLALRARKGKVRSALRVAEFALARREAEALRTMPGTDAEALTLYGDAIWSAGLFDEADRAYRDAVAAAPESARARFGTARSLAA